MSATDTERSDNGPATPSRSVDSIGGVRTTNRRRTRRRAAYVLGAAAAILAVVAGFVVFEPDRPLSPAAALTEAAQNTDEALTLRSEYRQDNDEGGLTVIRSEHRGGDVRRTFSTIEADGTERTDVESDLIQVYIGDKGWRVADGEVTTVKPEGRNAPYAESSAAIVRAAVNESTVSRIGVEDVRGRDATHYRLDLDAAAIERLERLPSNQLSGFELEYPGEILSLDVWIADGYIRRIRVVQNFEGPDSPGTTVEFYDFGADITIEAPT